MSEKSISPEVEEVALYPVAELEAHPMLSVAPLIPDLIATLDEQGRTDAEQRERIESLAADWAAWISEVETHGIREPLRIVRLEYPVDVDPLYYVIDGRHRLAAAMELGLETVPAVIVPESEVPAYIAGTVNGRRHWTKSQRAWFAVQMHPSVTADGRQGGDRRSKRTECALKNEDLAGRYGVSLRMIVLAIELHKLLERYPEFRDSILPSLWSGAGLIGLLNGLKSLIDGKTGPGKPAGLRHPPTKLATAFATERAAAANWELATDDQRLLLGNELARSVKQLPEEYLKFRLEVELQIAADLGIEINLSSLS